MAKKLGERLVDAGLITKEAVEQALQHQKITGHRLGECLVEIGLIQETALLRFLASEFNTRFVSADKLSKVKIPAELLDKVPVRMAEAQLFLPIAADPDRKILSVVAAEPQNSALLQEIALVTGMDEVYAYVALRSSILAGIKKHYYGDPTAFTAIGGINSAVSSSDLKSPSSNYESGRTESRSSPAIRFETQTHARLLRNTQIGNAPTGVREALGARGWVADSDFAETLNILVGMLELSRKGMRGHSSQLARQATLVARRLGLSPKETSHVVVAAYLHDLGKPTERHFTLASNAQDLEWKAEAKRYARAPVRLFETVHLAPQVNTILAQLYEAFDGSGTPAGAKGEEIALGARILAAVDAYLDLMKNPKNAQRRVLSRDEALAHLNEQSGTLYDPLVVDSVGRIHSGELLRLRIETDGRQVLIADPDEAIRTDLMDTLGRRGLVAQSLSTLEGAIDAALTGELDVLVLGLRFGVPEALGLLDLLRAQPTTSSVPVVILGEPPDAMAREQLAQAGVAALVKMPFDPEEAAGTIAALYEERIVNGSPAHAVRGSFDEMPQAELLRVLGAGAKTGRVTFRSEGQEGHLHLEKGRVVFASYAALGGEEAARALLRLDQADFSYDPDALLLELPQLDAAVEVLAAEQLEAADAADANGAGQVEADGG